VSTADPSSSIFYSRSKGQTEEALAELGYKETVMFRPLALSNTKRPEFRFAESVFVYATPFLPFFLFHGNNPSLTDSFLLIGFQSGHWRTRPVQR
jgi:uncharacterized protein YbjT (DUF2867 family)